MTHKEFYKCIRNSFGAVPPPAARPILAEFDKDKEATEISLRYEWIRKWKHLDNIDFRDGQEWITFIRN